jgi:hypothetical protein
MDRRKRSWSGAEGLYGRTERWSDGSVGGERAVVQPHINGARARAWRTALRETSHRRDGAVCAGEASDASAHACACERLCVRACVCARVRARVCERARVRTRWLMHARLYHDEERLQHDIVDQELRVRQAARGRRHEVRKPDSPRGVALALEELQARASELHLVVVPLACALAV